ncbi:alpha/beta hydrolase [Nocardioides humilatus]|uniref:Alpha/beta hydrolase n=1 Tax=Nocardioides humilatus TaxID=2607660 RepID=A0A5B1LBH3_9ACTN|nr:alpha/beta hydrolase [Nocardioides humilatus]KAA1417786.1 alpha/beta hydrolase [Nocardioides humilatus]
MTTFVLIHGAWHGAWCWERLVPELAARGHRSVTMDLPNDDASATFTTYADVVLEAMDDAGVGADAVVVGHSLGAMVLPLVAARREVARLVPLCGVVPNLDGQPWEDAPPMGQDDYGYVTDDDGAVRFDSLEAATAIFYADCDPADAAWAFAHLRPMRNASLWDRPYPLESWPDAPISAIACVDDLAIYADYQRATLRSRFGVTPVEMPGHHSPFLADPGRLADALGLLA